VPKKEAAMREQLEKRLEELQAEFEAGQAQLQELENQANSIRSTLLRISGAIQVLKEELMKSDIAEKESLNLANGSSTEITESPSKVEAT
jgi:predicted nuclease with TOPRIM domain